jgi:hypothetical protein
MIREVDRQCPDSAGFVKEWKYNDENVVICKDCSRICIYMEAWLNLSDFQAMAILFP